MINAALAAYDLGTIHAVTPLRGGRMARSWHVRAAAGDFVLRQAEPDLPGRLPLTQRQELLRHLAAHLPEVPRLLPNTRGETLTESDGQRWELLTFIPGETLDEAAGVQRMPPETLTAAARLLARYHQAAATFPFAPPFQETACPSPGEEISTRWQRLHSRLSQAPPTVLPELRGPAAEQLAASVRSLQQFWSATVPHPLTPSPPPSLPHLWAHGDFTPYNLVYRAGLPIGLLDFGAVHWAPAAYDLAVALLAFPEQALGVRRWALGVGIGKQPTPSPHRDSLPSQRPTPNAQRPTPKAQRPAPAFLAAYASERPLSAAEQSALPHLMRHRRVIAVLWIAEECLAGREELRPKLIEYFPQP